MVITQITSHHPELTRAVVQESLPSLRQRYGSNKRSIEVRIHRHKDRHAAHAHVSGAESRSRTICVARHTQYNIGATYALLGETRQSVSWLKKASREGLPCYPLFERDPTLDSLRQDPEFVAFMQQLKSQAEQFRSTL